MANLITLQEYKTAINVNTTAYDGQLNALLPMISDAIKQYCGQEFANGSYVEKNSGVVSPEGYYMFYVKNKPITSVTSVALRFYGTGASIDLDTTLFDIRENEGYVVFAGAINPGVALIRPEYQGNFYYTITYVGGPALTPNQVKMACIYALSDNFLFNYGNQILSGTTSLQGETKQMKVGDYSITQLTPTERLSKLTDLVNGVMFTKTVRNLLAPYANVGQSGGCL